MVTAAPERGVKPRMTRVGPEGDSWPRIGVTPAELVLESGSLRVLHYPAKAPKKGPPFLLVMPVINRAYIIDLTPTTSIVGALQAAGIDTFVVDWGKPRLHDRNKGLDELVTTVLPRVERKVLEFSGAKELVLAGYCLGGTIAVCRAARGAAAKNAVEKARHAGLVTIHTPVSFANTGLIGQFAAPENFPLESILGAFGNMPGWLLQQGFYGQKPLQQVSKYKKVFQKVAKEGLETPESRDAVEEFLALERWNSDNVPVTGAFYRRLIQDLYRDDRLTQGTLTIKGEPISLRAIKCPVLVVVAKDDPICLPHQARALAENVSSASKETLELTGGHVRSLSGPKARHPFAKKLAAWVAARS
ncbi:MAG TPA: alpha/beta fold hydrolase [Planctomycetota bacterium]|nr:alpha/beta fold hydrolase [Planctomycetota bacterium]